jgi:putative ABC transport system permease protein
MSPAGPMLNLWQDVLFGLRSMRRAPGFAFTVVLTLGLGIAAATVMFSLVNGVLLRSLPFANESRLVWAVNRGARHYDAVSPPDFIDWREQARAFAEMGTFVKGTANLDGALSPVRLGTAEVTANWFSMLGVQLQLGRGFVAGEEGDGAANVVVLSDALWRTQFGADRGILNRTVLLDGTTYTVVGVAPGRFDFPEKPDLWRPMKMDPRALGCRACRMFWGPIGLLKPGTSLEQARSDVRAITARLHTQYPDAETGLTYDLVPLRQYIVGDTRTALLVLLGAVMCLLLIACANVATLLLVRATSRSAEIGMRIALGALPQRIVMQLLAEGLVLAVLGGAVGTVLAEWGVHAAVAAEIGNLPLLAGVTLDPRVLAFALTITVVTGILFGVAPALQAARTDVMLALKMGARGVSARKDTATLRDGLVMAELALALPLLIGASLLGRSFARLTAVDPGFHAAQVVQFDINLPVCGTSWAPDTTCANVQGTHYSTPAERRAFTEELLRRLSALPGTEAAAAGFGVPFTEWAKNQTQDDFVGRAPAPADRPYVAEQKYVTPAYFAALGIPVLRGRVITGDERADGPHVVVVSKSFADAYLPGEDPIGKRLKLHGEIIGVVGDTKALQLATAIEPALYTSYAQTAVPTMTFLVRSSAGTDAAMAAARAQVASIDKALPLFHLMPMVNAVVASAAAPRLDAWVVGGFAVTALLLAVVGIYGLISYTVRERHREMGIRIALGARPDRVVGLVLGRSLRLVAGGVGLGLALAVVGSRALRGLLFGIGTTDVTTYVAASVALVLVALVASWVPARRAARIDPIESLRAE